MKLHIDVETYSSQDITVTGAYKYTKSFDFEILMVAYAFDNEPISIVDLAAGENLPLRVIEALKSDKIIKCAHNANFERQAFRAIGIDVPIEQWECTAIKAAYCGLPLSLDQVSKALNLEDLGKSSTGKSLIRYFSIPIQPTKTNGFRHRNLYFHDLEKWEEFKKYCVKDVEAERAIDTVLSKFEVPNFERQAYILDQKINDRGVLIDLDFAKSAIEVDFAYKNTISERLLSLTKLDNPNSVSQIKKWLEKETDSEITSLSKNEIPKLLQNFDSEIVKEVLELRQKASKTSVKKYSAMVNCANINDRANGLFQFYGANRTGRWAGRLIQLQNLPRNYIKDLDGARKLVKDKDVETLEIIYENAADILSQLIRTSFTAPEHKTLAVADFSAIEARVLAWIAGETWRINVFNTHGKIYEASAAAMFNVPIECIGKGSEERQKGKIAELALGYGGSVGAMKKMGGEEMGLSDTDMQTIVSKWRKANPSIVEFWTFVEKAALKAVIAKTTTSYKGLIFSYDTFVNSNGVEEAVLKLTLPSGRTLFYQRPKIKPNRFGGKALFYEGLDQTTKKWTSIDTYGGKLTENIVQAIARDLLLESMFKLDKKGFEIVMHIHDEVVAEIDEKDKDKTLIEMCEIMGGEIEWAKGLPLGADGYTTKFYKKD